MTPYHHQQSQPAPHYPSPMSPVTHSKSTEFPRSNGYFDGPTGLPAGAPMVSSSSGMMSSQLSRSTSSGYVWKDEHPMPLDQDPHHIQGELNTDNNTSICTHAHAHTHTHARTHTHCATWHNMVITL